MIKFSLMANVQEVYEPQVFEEEKGRPKWEKAMVIEHESLMKNETWDLITRPLRKKWIGCNWVHKIKYKVDGTLDKYKEILVTKWVLSTRGH
jgi:hypothetical protein